MSRVVSAAVACACLAMSLLGQGGPVIPSGMTTVNLYAVAGPPLGGIVFDPLGGALYVANYGGGWIESHPVTRDPVTGQITGFGTPSAIASAVLPWGLDKFAGTYIWTTYNNTLDQYAASGALASEDLTVAGVPQWTGGLRIVPPGLPGAGNCYVSSYTQGSIYQIPLTPNPNGNGTFQVPPNSATLFATTPVGAEGMGFIPSGPYAGSILHSNYDNGDLTVIVLDTVTGLPTGQTETFITNVPWPMGVDFDPLTGDLFVATNNGLNPGGNLYHFSGTIAGDYQLNQPGASFEVNGVQGSLVAPALTVAPAGTPLTVAWTSTNAGLPFDVALAISLIPAGYVSPGAQIINIDLGSPYNWVFGGTFTNTFAPASFTYAAPGSSVAAQMGVVDPTYALGVAVSQPNLIQ
ncbi:MAG: hypothetical protein VX913_16310 [Planctomycetota bacterium]|nr:hypothetical protein [Planctomycetota bacterium]